MIPHEEVILVWESDFSKLVSETYGRPYRLQQGSSSPQDMMGQEEVRIVDVPTSAQRIDEPYESIFEEWRDADATKPEGLRDWEWNILWERAQNDKWAPLEPLVNDLHERGLLIKGRYVIRAWW